MFGFINAPLTLALGTHSINTTHSGLYIMSRYTLCPIQSTKCILGTEVSFNYGKLTIHITRILLNY